MTPQRKPVPAEALAVLRRHLAVLPPRHRERRALMASTCTLYGISRATLYRLLREGRRPRDAHRSDRGRPRLMPTAEIERWCEIVAALKARTTNKKGRCLSTARVLELLAEHGVETPAGLEQLPKGRITASTLNRHMRRLGYDHVRMTRQPPAVRFEAERSNDLWHFDLSPSDLKQLPAPSWVDTEGGSAPTLMLFSVVDDRSGLAYLEYHCVHGEDVEAALRFLFVAMSPKPDNANPLQGMPNKTDRNDARGLAQIVRTGWYRVVHVKSPASRSWRALLTARRLVLNKMRDVENGLRALLREAGLKLGTPARKAFAARVRELTAADPVLARVAEPLLTIIAAMARELAQLTKRVLDIVRDEPVCRRLMGVPGVGPLTALAFRATIDQPNRFRRSRDVGAHLGLTPKRYQSGETDVQGGISRCGDELARTALYEAAHSLLSRSRRWSTLRAWGMQVAKRRGMARARIAVARKLAAILHRMWADGTQFRCGKDDAAIAA